MNNITEAAQHLARHWLEREHTQALPQDCRPATRAEGYAVQALIWFFDEMSSAGQRIKVGQFLTTGACVTPIPVEPGQTLQADFGWLGAMRVRFVDEAGDPRD